MKILEIDQRSPEWYRARCGIPTASGFDKILTSDGSISKQRTKYLYQLAAEKISGIPVESYQSAAMLRGIEMENEVRELYEFMTGQPVQTVGFCLSDCGSYGASPDGLIGDDGVVEIKCPLPATHVTYLLEGRLPVEYFQQVQGELLVTGRAWCDFLSYFPGVKPLLIRVERSSSFLGALQAELGAFCQDLANVISRISQ